MKRVFKISCVLAIASAICFSCHKKEESAYAAEMDQEYASSESKAPDAKFNEVDGKKFIRKADIDMEVKDVYESTIFIENKLISLGGFVTSSNLHKNIISQDTYNTSEEKAILVRKYQSENRMQVRVPTVHLGDFLKFINDKSVFLNSRIITAEDMTSEIKYAELESKRLENTGKNINDLKTSTEKVKMSDSIAQKQNRQVFDKDIINNDIKYSTVDIYIKEPNVSISEIAINNTDYINNKYKTNFFYDVKTGFINGFYIIQMFFILITNIWPLLIVTGIVIYILRKRGKILNKRQK